MEIVLILLTGLAVGVVAKFLMPGDDPGGLILTTVLGIVGAFIGGYLSGVLGFSELGGVGSFAFATAGAMLVLVGYRLIKGRR